MRNLCFLILLGLGSAAAASELEPLLDYPAPQLYQRFCASCHGPLGAGDGPVAPVLKVMIPDLREISRRNRGTFPLERIREIVDGRAVLPAHGSRLMPVWGYELEAQAPPESAGRAAAQTLVDRLVGYLQDIQR